MLRKKGNAQRLGVILPSILEAQQKAHRPLAMIQDAWSKLVGERMAAHSKPVGLRQGRLIVHVDQPGDNFVLSFQRSQLLKRLKGMPELIVDEIIFRAGET